MSIGADIFVSPLIEWVVSKSLDLLLEEIQLLRGAGDEIRALSSKLEIIDAYVRRAETRQSEEVVAVWLKKLRKISLDAKDTFDALKSNLSLKALKEARATFPAARHLRMMSASPARHLASLHGAATRIALINTRIDELVKLSSLLNLSLGPAGWTFAAGDDDRMQAPTGHLLTVPQVFGRVADEQKVIDMLSPPRPPTTPARDQISATAPNQNPSVVAIVGMGGIGKTTLVQSVYEKVYTPKCVARTDQHKIEFDEKMWICVAETFNVAKILHSVIEAIDKKCEANQMSNLENQLGALLRDKRYLLVLDDVWNEDFDKWAAVVTSLKGGAPGSKILVTTRNQQVVQAMHVSESYPLRGLSDEDCRSIFEANAFYGENAKEFPELVDIGREIVTKCKGVPLAAKVLGSLLFPTRDKEDWLKIKNVGISDICNDDERIRSILRLSYNHLAPHLKQCFVYCSIYPKDTEIDVKDLIRQWIAHGFIPSCGPQKMEDVGCRYFSNLLWRSFFQEETKDVYGNIHKCKMHDLIHDLAESIAGDELLRTRQENCLAESITGDELSRTRQKDIDSTSYAVVRHLRILTTFPEAFHKLGNLHTFSIFDYEPNSLDVLKLEFSSIRYLRVLNLSKVHLKMLPKSIDKLILLRYLHVAGIESLPNSIYSLLNLQTFLLGCLHAKLPIDIASLKSLRHLEFERLIMWDCMPPGIRQLSSLQTLSEFVVSTREGCKIDELGRLDLGGTLCISKLENVSDGASAKGANLVSKQSLQELTLRWSPLAPRQKMNEILEALQPHPNLKRLEIENYNGDSLPEWLEDLTSLHSLALTDLQHVICLPTELRHLPLQNLVIKGCPQLYARYNRRNGSDRHLIENIPNINI